MLLHLIAIYTGNMVPRGPGQVRSGARGNRPATLAVAVAALLAVAQASHAATGESLASPHADNAAAAAFRGLPDSAAESRRNVWFRIAQASPPGGSTAAGPDAVAAIRPRPRQVGDLAAGADGSGGGQPVFALPTARPAPRPEHVVARAAEIRRRPTAVAPGERPRPRPAGLLEAYVKRQVEVDASARRNGRSAASDIGSAAVYPVRMAKNRMTIVSISGKAPERRAIVRLPSGRYLPVKSGQTVGGWRVAEITGSSILLVSGNRRRTLQFPD